MISKILKIWLEAHPWLKLATIENDLDLPKRFLTSEAMQDSKALVKACYALQNYGFQIAPNVQIVAADSDLLEIKYTLDNKNFKGDYKTFIKNIEFNLVEQLNKENMTIDLSAFGLRLKIKGLKVMSSVTPMTTPKEGGANFRKAVDENSIDAYGFWETLEKQETDPNPVLTIFKLKTPLKCNGNYYEAISINNFEYILGRLVLDYDEAIEEAKERWYGVKLWKSNRMQS